MEHTIISPAKANSLYWLGRYVERVHIDLHLLRKCFDMMIDGDSEDYNSYIAAIGNGVVYPDESAMRNGMLHDSTNPASIISCIERANDNGVVLRDEIKSATLGYIQLALEYIRNKAKSSDDTSVEELQTLTDWMLAFWGSIESRVFDQRVKTLLRVGKLIEYIDMHIRFNYPFYRIEEAFESLVSCCMIEPRAFNENAMDQLKLLLTEDLYKPEDVAYKAKVLTLLFAAVTL